MSKERKKLLLIGGLLVLAGALTFSFRDSLAATFLGLSSNVIFGMGWAEEEGIKVVAVGSMGAGIFIAGLAIGIAGFLENDQGRVICPKYGHSNSKYRVTCKSCRAEIEVRNQFLQNHAV